MGTPAYFAPYIDTAGLHIPPYAAINAQILNAYLTNYAQNVDPGNNEADIQQMANFALIINDAFNTAQLVYNGRSPATAIGADLDGIVKVNGIARLAASYSQAVLTLTGTANAEIDQGLAQDANGNIWALPITVFLSLVGTATVIATCQTIGDIGAPAGSINIIATPTSGWNTVNNAAAATPGLPTESDSALRARQALSVALSSKTLVTATLGAIAQVPNVIRYGNIGIENPTGGTDSFGNPPHSISMVVQGGTDAAVAQAIYNNKTPGTDTNGTTTVSVTDPTSLATLDISFFRPTLTPIYVSLTINAFTGYSSATKQAIHDSVVNYLNALQIGETVTISGLYAVAMSNMPNILLPLYSITALKAGLTATPTGTSDITLAFNAVSEGISANVIVTP